MHHLRDEPAPAIGVPEPGTALARIGPASAPCPPVRVEPVALPDVVGLDLVGAFLAGRKPTTLDAYRRDLDDFARFLGVPTATAAAELLVAGTAGQANTLALGYRADLTRRGLAPATIARRLAALRSMVKLARTLGRVAWSMEIEGPRADTYTETAGPGAPGWRSMLDQAKGTAAEGTAKGARDLAIVRLLHDLALRRAEAVGLDLADIEAGLDGQPAAIWILGKGRASRERLTVPGPVREALAAWLHHRGTDPGPLFVRLDPGGRSGGRLTGRAVHKIVRALGAAAGLGRPVRPHGLRHQGITRALDVSGGNVREVQRFSRHRKVEVLLRYDDNRRDVAGELARRVSED